MPAATGPAPRRPLPLLVLLGLAACAEPPQNTSPYVPIGEAGPPPGGPSSGAERAMDAGGPGAPGDPPPGGEGAGAPGPGEGSAGGADSSGGGCRLTPSWEGQSTAGGATLAGTVTGDGGGPLLVDIIDAETKSVVWGVECPGPGAISLTLPPSLGEVWVAAYVDLTGDGPSADDPQGRSDDTFAASEPPDDLRIAVATGTPITGILGPAGGPPPDEGPGGPPPDEGAAPAGDGELAPPPAAGSCSAVGETPDATAGGPTVSVVLTVPPGAAGAVLLDVVRAEDHAVLHSAECALSRDLELALPPGLGAVYLAGFLDAGGDGPSADDPQGRSDGSFTAAGGAGPVALRLSPDGDLSQLQRPAPAGAGTEDPAAADGAAPDPGGPPPGSGAPPAGGPPTDAPPAGGPPADAPPPGAP